MIDDADGAFDPVALPVPRAVGPDAKVSAILLSWRRQDSLKRIVEDLRSWQRIGEIVVWNNDGERSLALPGATVIQSQRNFSCLARYVLPPLAANDTIWFQDDDLMVTEAQFEKIFATYLTDQSRIYGCRGRNLENGVYSMRQALGSCDIIVGQTMLFHRSLLRHLYRFLGRIPLSARADDIAFSLACPTRHFAVDVGPLHDVGYDDDNALWRQPGHIEARQEQVDMMLPFRRTF
jgi:hypothetical protein